MSSRCLWTGQPIADSRKGGHTRKFASSAARAAAHRAARQYALHLIDSGELTWERLRAWDRERSGHAATYTAAAEEGSE